MSLDEGADEEMNLAREGDAIIALAGPCVDSIQHRRKAQNDIEDAKNFIAFHITDCGSARLKKLVSLRAQAA
jgi:hypothetical protein